MSGCSSNSGSLSVNDTAVLQNCFNESFGFIDLSSASTVVNDANIQATEHERQAAALEHTAVTLAEQNSLKEALHKLDEAIALAPDRASCYNNRAQVLRLMGRNSEAMADLDRAIALASSDFVLTTRQAFTQRACLHRLGGNDELARHDFEQAAKMGSIFAKQQLIAMNPYAAMCNQMLSDMIGRLQRGEDSVF